MAKNLHLCFTPIKSPESRVSRFSGPAPSLLIKNFNSLYENFTTTQDLLSTSESGDESGDGTAVPDFATAVASRRFFFSSPGVSNSIVDSSSLSPPAAACPASSPPSGHPENGGGVAVPTYSPDPFVDFRRSMQEMVEAREVHDVRESWGYLHELLTCYLSLNPKSTHKFIVGAFSDLLVSLLAAEGRRENPFSGEVSPQCV